jgi:hypothetical protein
VLRADYLGGRTSPSGALHSLRYLQILFFIVFLVEVIFEMKLRRFCSPVAVQANGSAGPGSRVVYTTAGASLVPSLHLIPYF